MKYEVLTLKKRFRYHADVMATPDKWWEKYLLFKKSEILRYQGTFKVWVDDQFNPAPPAITVLIDQKFNEQYTSAGIFFFGILANVFNKLFNGDTPPKTPPFKGKP
jgi:hypothetical protein